MSKQFLNLLVLLVAGYANAACLTDSSCKSQCVNSVCPASGQYAHMRPVDGYCKNFVCHCIYGSKSRKC